jgi:hypothetical protein
VEKKLGKGVEVGKRRDNLHRGHAVEGGGGGEEGQGSLRIINLHKTIVDCERDKKEFTETKETYIHSSIVFPSFFLPLQ